MVTHSGWASDTRPDAPQDHRSLGQLVSDLSEQASRLVRAEIDLAKAEMAAKAKQAGIGAGLLAAAGVLGLYAFGTLLATIIIALANVVDAWLAALIVTVVLLAVTGVLALLGVKRLQKGVPPTPERAVENVHEDVEAVKKGFAG
ncbi:phage holin family protein [Cellulomonas sp. NPDC057328]|uniref:phage holin family protein n=1 Tax=unclassified Cellulomonas TaxID=2620175 RepID=UPI00362C25F7